MLIELLPTQTKVLNDVRYARPKSTNIINYVGGLGSGKTFLGALITACYIYAYPMSKVCMAGPTIPLVKDNTFAYTVKFLKILGQEPISLNKEKTMWLCPNGTTIMITHGASYKQILTYEFNFIDIEEASKISNSVLKQFQGRLRYVNGNAPLILLTHTNPPSSTNHYCLTSGKVYIGSSYENTNLPEGYIDGLSKNMTAEEKEKFINGKITPALDDALISNFDPLSVKCIPTEIPTNNYSVFITCDFNYSPQCWLSGLISSDGRFFFLHEHFNLKTHTEVQAQSVLEFLIDNYNCNKIVIYGDSAGAYNQRLDNDYVLIERVADSLGLLTELRVLPSNPRITQRLSIFRTHVLKDKYKFNLDNMKKTNYVFENTRIDITTGKILNPTKQELDIEPDLIYTPHAIDAISYLMYFEETTKGY